MKIITRILDVVCTIFKWITAAILAAMLIASVAEIVRRYILGHSFVWADEFIRYCIVARGVPGRLSRLSGGRRSGIL